MLNIILLAKTLVQICINNILAKIAIIDFILKKLKRFNTPKKSEFKSLNIRKYKV